jgi:hypothetical protein
LTDSLGVRQSDAARLLALSAIWGASFIFIRVLAPVLGPVLTVTTRLLMPAMGVCSRSLLMPD